MIQFQFQTQREASKHNKRGRMSHGCTLDEIDYIFNLHHAMMHKSLSRPRVSLLHFQICTEAEHLEHVQIQIQLVVCLWPSDYPWLSTRDQFHLHYCSVAPFAVIQCQVRKSKDSIWLLTRQLQWLSRFHSVTSLAVRFGNGAEQTNAIFTGTGYSPNCTCPVTDLSTAYSSTHNMITTTV